MTPSPSPSVPDRIARRVARALGALPEPVQRFLGGRPVRIDGQELCAEVQLAMRLLGLTVKETFETLPLHEGRAQIEAEAWVFGEELPVGAVEDTVLATEAGALPARIYRPAGAPAPTPALVYFHGGGWVLGGLGAADSVARFLTREAGVTVISVDYRLAPEHKFPAAVDDAVAAFTFVVAHAAELGVDPQAVAIGGESAGGNLAAVVAQQLAPGTDAPDRSGPAFQLLFMPVTDLSTKHPSYALFGEGFFLTDAQMDWYKAHYLSDDAEALDPRVSPLLADDVARVAPAYVVVAGFDVLRDEGEAYAAKLAVAGVPVALRRHEGITHSLINAIGVGRIARDVLFEAAGALRVGLASAGVPVTRR